MIHVAIADDHTIFRNSLYALVESFNDVKVVAQASDGVELLEKLRAVNVDIVLLDLQMPRMDGFETCEHIQKEYPDTKILVLTHLTDTDTLRKILRMEVNGYLSKNADTFELDNAIHQLNENGVYFEKNFTTIIEDILNNPIETSDVLIITEREKEIINLVIQEFSGKEIATHLGISIKTVETHKRNLVQKINSKSFMGVITYALEKQLVELPKINRDL